MKRGYRVLLMVLGVNLAQAFAAAGAGAMAQYPNKPIRFILPFPGGATDFLGRVVGQRLAEALGQPVVIDNRPGAGGNLGIELAARSAPDGYTLVLVAPNITISPSLYRKLNYDPVRDFAPVTPVATVTMVIITHPALPAHQAGNRQVEQSRAHGRVAGGLNIAQTFTASSQIHGYSHVIDRV